MDQMRTKRHLISLAVDRNTGCCHMSHQNCTVLPQKCYVVVLHHVQELYNTLCGWTIKANIFIFKYPFRIFRGHTANRQVDHLKKYFIIMNLPVQFHIV